VRSLIAHGVFGHDALGRWALDPLAIATTTTLAVAYVLGWRRDRDGAWRAAAFGTGLAAGVVALMSPIHVAADESLSWHMVQHVLLIGLATPLIVVSVPGPTLMRGLGRRAPALTRRSRQLAGLGPQRLRRLRHPLARWVLFVAVLWGWHSARLYTAAVEHESVHALEHASFVVAALLVWSSVLGPRRASGNADPAMRVLVVFLLGVQGVLLSLLMTFSRHPWYPVYDGPGRDALADQHLAGVLMWVPLGALYAAVGIWTAMRWLGADD
jgi:putative membrane protein